MDERLYWMWLQYAMKPGAVTRTFADKYPSAKAFYEAGEQEWKSFFSRCIGCFRRATEKSPEDFSETLSFCDKHSLKTVTPDSAYYPQNLLTIDDFPLVLFVRGDCECLNAPVPFGVIGSRTPSVYGERAAREITARLSESGAVIVSGGALGIDSVAHKAALGAGGKTVLVMGCGHGNGYLPENAELRKAVTRQGAVISEYPPFSNVTQGSFPMRNRIISGMSKGVVIVEAADRSGTFSTANHARRQGRALFVLPGDIESGNFAGSNQLITEGATAVFSGEDVLRKCGLFEGRYEPQTEKTGEVFADINLKSEEGKKSIKKAGRKAAKSEVKEKAEEKTEEKIEIITKNLPEGISKNAEIVYNIMSDGVNEVDDIKRNSGLEIRHVLVALTELEILGYAERKVSNRYVIK